MKLFKFVEAERIDVLEKERIACTPPDRFKDPFEVLARFTPAVARKIWDDTFEDFKRSALSSELSPRQRKKKARRLKEEAKVGIGFDEVKKRLEETATAKIRHNLGIICFGAEIKNNLLWYHYADGHRGLVIEFDSDHPEFAKLGNLQKVRYDCPPPVYGLHAPPTMDLLTVKPPYLAYEVEYRILCQLTTCKKESPRGGLELYFRDIPKTCIKAVHLGHRLSAPDFQRLSNAVAGTQIECFRVSPSGRDYELKWEKM